MRKNIWQEKLSAFKENEQPEATLMIAGQTELMRIALAWKQTEVSRGRRLSKLQGNSEADIWAWLWKNVRYDRAALLGRIPGASNRTARNLDALIGCRVLYPDGTINAYVERYLKERVVKLFAPAIRKRGLGAA